MFEHSELPDGTLAKRHYLGTDQPRKPCARCGQSGPVRYFFFTNTRNGRPRAVCRYCHLEEKLRLVLALPAIPVDKWPVPRLPLNLGGDTARITLANGRGRAVVVLHRWALRVDDDNRRTFARPRVKLTADVHDDRMPHGTHLVAADLPGVPGTVCLPAPISMSGDPYLGFGRWQITLAWQWPQFGQERPGHAPTCVYCVHGPDCPYCPPPPEEAGPLTPCGPCGEHVLTAELHARVRAETHFESLC